MMAGTQDSQSHPHPSSPNFGPTSSLPSLQLTEHPSQTEPHPQTDPQTGFTQIRKLENTAKLMLEAYCSIIERASREEKIIGQEEIGGMVGDLQEKYQGMMEILEGLPIEERIMEERERDVLARHREAVGEFKQVLKDAAAWKNQIRTLINQQLQTKN